MKRYFGLYFTAIAMFWVGVAVIVIGHHVTNHPNLLESPFWNFTISRQVGWERWSEILFVAVNVIVGVMVGFFVKKNALHWGLSKNLERLLYVAIALFFLVSFLPYDPTLGTVIAHQVTAILMMALAGAFVIAILIKNKPWQPTINFLSGVFMGVLGIVFCIMFLVCLDLIWSVIFFVESFYILGFFIFLPTVPVKPDTEE